METITVGEHVFEIVNEVPRGYMVWNIGDNMAEGYLPFCRLSTYQPFPDGRNIEVDTLKALKCEGAREILSIASFGCRTIDDVEEYLNKHKNPKPGTATYMDVQRCKEALPYMRKINLR